MKEVMKKGLMLALCLCWSASGRTDSDYLHDLCASEQEETVKTLQQILSPARVVTAGSFPNSFVFGTSDLDFYVLPEENCSGEDHKAGSYLMYEALKKTFPQAMMTEKEMGRHLINIPTPNSHCTEDVDLTYIPNLVFDAASARVRQGWMLAEEKKKLWNNTIASRDEMSEAVRTLKTAAKLSTPTLILDQNEGEEEDKVDDIIRKLLSSLDNNFCLTTSVYHSSCVCGEVGGVICFEPWGSASLPDSLKAIIDVVTSNKERRVLLPDNEPTTLLTLKRLAVALLCRKAWDSKTRIYRELLFVRVG